MKYFILVSFLIFCNSSSAQNNSSEKQNDTLKTSQVKAEKKLSGGINQFYIYVTNHLRTPNAFNFPGGKEIVKFTVKADGTVGDIIIIKDIGYGVGAQITKILKNSPKWAPGTQNGKPVDVTFTLPITLESSNDD